MPLRVLRLFRLCGALGAALLLWAGAALVPPAPANAQAQAVMSATEQPVALVGATVINPEGAAPIDSATVVLRDSTIAAVGPSRAVTVPDGARVVNVDGKYIIPGLVDGHVHFFQSGGLYTRPDVVDLRMHRPYTAEIRRVKDRLPDTFRHYLRSGVTSVVDVGGPMWNFDVRARADTTAAAPRVTIAGPLLSPVQPPALDVEDPPIIEVNDPERARELVREQLARGVDLIKIWYIVQGDETPEDHLPMVEAAIDEAHQADTRVAVHATELETARTAVEAGADILVHSVFDQEVDGAFVKLLQQNDVLYTPTLMVRQRYRETFAQQLDFTVAEHQMAQTEVVSSLFDVWELPREELPERVRSQMGTATSVAPSRVGLQNLRMLHRAGVPIVAGTDAGNIGTPHGPSIFREMELMREAGLSPMAVLTAATVGGARLAGRADRQGVVEPGRLADLVVLNANPLDDIMNTADIHRVVKGGHVFAPSDLVPVTPSGVVQRQVNAYNARDLEAFLSFYSPEIVIENSRGDTLVSGADQLRARYEDRFAGSPRLHANILGRMVMGNVVVDRERATGLEGGPSNLIAIYRIENGRIRHVEFVRNR